MVMNKLLLMIRNPNALEKGTLPSHLFDETGGSVGADKQNAWQIDNYTHSIKEIAFSIESQDSEYCLVAYSEDIFINHSHKPLPPHLTIRLKTGDCIKLCDYVIQVKHISNHADLVSYEQDLLDILGASETLLLDHDVAIESSTKVLNSSSEKLLTMENHETITDPVLLLDTTDELKETEELTQFYDFLGIIPNDNLNASIKEVYSADTARTHAHTVPVFAPVAQEPLPPRQSIETKKQEHMVNVTEPVKPREILDPLILLEKKE